MMESATVAVALALLSTNGQSGLSVAGPPALMPCLSPTRVELEIRRKLGAGQLATFKSAGWVLSYDVVPVRVGDAEGLTPQLQVQIVGPAGQPSVLRSFAVAPNDCDNVAETIAVIVQRQVRQIAWTMGLALPPPLPTPIAQPKTQLAAPSGTGITERGPSLGRLFLDAGPALVRRSAAEAQLALDLRAGLIGPLHVRLGALLPGAGTVAPAESGEARASSWFLRGSILWARAFSHFDVQGGPEALLGIESAHTTGITLPAQSSRRVLALGLGSAISLKISPRWRLAVEASGYRGLLGSDFYVQTSAGRTTVLPLSAWQGLVALKLGFLLWP